MMKIGNITCENNLVLAPMAGITDLPFRRLCKEQGCGLLYTEMVSAKAILYSNKNTHDLMKVGNSERPIALQLFGSDPKIISEMAAQIEEGPYDIIDINMGCPVPKVVNNHEGSALLTDPKLAGDILREVVKAIHKPVTVKIRIGFDKDHINAVEISKIAEQAGVSAIAVHGRTRDQYYSGNADWGIIRQVKRSVNIPVIGNGDVVTPKDAKRLIDETGCDGIMIGRAARGNPWIFKQTNHFLNTGEMIAGPSKEEMKAMILRHGRLLVEAKGEYTGIREMRKHVAWYTTGLSHSAALRRNVNKIENYEQLEQLIHDRM